MEREGRGGAEGKGGEREGRGGAGGKGGSGIDVPTVRSFAASIAEVARMGAEIAIVCGSGNILRGAEFSQLGAERANSDYMGMLATVMNALAMQNALEQIGVPTRVQRPMCRRRWLPAW